ncbi:MFS transporter [Aneurinibacillus migulanus]|uniref:MFS transporter n=1 Tax=Aneurinibacillus migulanus TaxID=47500 RepID=UPI0005B7BB85|nr:MFS transporter [Aneurinibacillus migulanus]KIV49919.1 MFS transporter [Aneurinibacillus migulanus]KPD04598.1 MFS transporter [Aneurinibacillus migulanus]MCP1358875.1 MFS transporter [Aneurinibacillus migulanus]
MQTITKKVWGYRHVILIILWLLYIINYFDRLAVLTFLPFIQQDLNLTPVQVGQLASIFFFAYSIAQVTAGFLADKIGPKKVMNIAIIVFTAVTALTGLVKSFAQFIALRIGLGLGEGHHFAPACRTINNWFPMAERGRSVSFFTTSWAVAPAIVPVLITSISYYFFAGEWRPIFYLLAIPGLLGMFILWYFVSDTPKEMLDKGRLTKTEYEHITTSDTTEEDEEGVPSNQKKNASVFLRDPSFYLYTLLLFCQLAVYWGTTTWLTTFLVQQHGLNIKDMGLFASAPYLVAIFAMLIGGWLMDKVLHRMKPVGIIAYLGSIPVLWMLGSVEKGQTGMLLTLLLLVGFFVNLNFGSVYAYIQKRYPKEIVGRATGLANGIGQLGSFISPLVAGYLVKVGTDGTQEFGDVFIFFAVCSMIAAICALLLKEQKSLPTSVLLTKEKNSAKA